jgi:hypothetical protein
MPKPIGRPASRPKRIPSYQLHKASGQARVILDGRHIYLGTYGSDDSRGAYARLIAEHFRPGGGRAGDLEAGEDCQTLVPWRYPDLSIKELLLRYLDFAEQYYVQDG